MRIDVADDLAGDDARFDAILEADAEIVEAIEKNRDVVEGETLSNVSTMSLDLSELRKQHDIDGRNVTLEINVADVKKAAGQSPDGNAETDAADDSEPADDSA